VTVYHADIVQKLRAVVANDRLTDSMMLEFPPPLRGRRSRVVW
jgi:hypothetical protein